ncbi:hypothetical protein D3C85_958040 [compost metagenome]
MIVNHNVVQGTVFFFRIDTDGITRYGIVKHARLNQEGKFLIADIVQQRTKLQIGFGQHVVGKEKRRYSKD